MMKEKTFVVWVNGVEESLSDTSLVHLLAAKGYDQESRGVAVAVQDKLARKEDWKECVLRDGDRIEIITAAQGG